MKKSKKLLSLLLAALMILSLLPTVALADGPNGTWEAAVTEAPEGFVINSSAKTIDISSAEGLAWFGKQLNAQADYSGYTITISGTIDMAEHYWIPINAHECGNLSGAVIKGSNDAKIQNLQINSVVNKASDESTYNYYSGFIGQIAGELTIKDLIFSGANVAVENSSGVAVVCGLTYGDLLIDNVTVTDSTVIGTTKTGALVGFTGGDSITVTIKNSKLENTTVKANYSFALMVGLANTHDTVHLTNTVAVNSTTEWIAAVNEFERGTIAYNGGYYSKDNGTLWLTDPAGAWVEVRTANAPKVTIGGQEYNIKGDWFIRPVAKVDKVSYCTIAAAVAAAQPGDTIELLQHKNGNENYNFTKADDGFCYVDAEKKTGRLVWLDVVDEGSETASTTFKVLGKGATVNLQTVLLNSESRYEGYNGNSDTKLKSGDIVILPAQTLYYNNDGSGIVDTYGDITLVGAGEDITIVRAIQTKGDSYRFFRLYNRYTKNIEENIIYNFNFKNLTIDGALEKHASANAFVVTCYNININADHVTFKNFDGAVFSVWANDSLNDSGYTGEHNGFTIAGGSYYPTKTMNSGVNITLKNVSTDNNGKLIHFDCSPYQTRDLDKNLDCYAYIHLNYDGTCSFNDKTGVAGNHVFTDPNHPGYDTATFSVNGSTAYCQNNCWINDVDVLPPVAQITRDDVTTGYATLADAVAAAQPGDTITMIKDAALGADVTINKNITLDLAGKTVETAGYTFNVNGANVTVTGNGTVNNEVTELGHPIFNVTNNATLTMQNGTFTTKSVEAVSVDGAHFVMNGGTINCTFFKNDYDTKSAISGKASSTLDILGGTINSYTSNLEYYGMYGIYVQTGTTLNLGKTCTVGPTIKSYFAPISSNGSNSPVTVNAYSGTFIGTCDVNDNGAESDMNVIQISANNAPGTNVNIYGGTFTQTATKNTSHAIEIRYTQPKTINISGGNFRSNGSVINSESTGGMKDENTTITISGGYFTSDPTAYLVSGKVAVASDKPGYSFMVGEKNEKIEVATDTNAGSPRVSGDNCEPDTPAHEVEAEVINVIKSNPTAVKGAEDLIPDAKNVANNNNTVPGEAAANEALQEEITVGEGDTITVVVEPYLEVAVKDAVKEDVASEQKITSVTFEIEAKYDLLATTAENAEAMVKKEDEGETNTVVLEKGKKLEVTQPVTITLPLPNNFYASTGSTVYIKHAHDGKTYVYNGTVTEAGGKKSVTFTNPNGFSEFTIVPMVDTVASIERGGNTMYFEKFEDAVAAVENDETIKLLQDCSETVTVARAVRFTLDKNENNFSGSITPGANYKNTGSANEGTISYVFTYVAPSGGDGAASYAVSVATATHGKVTVDKASASAGRTVTITVAPEKGFTLETLTVKDAKGNEVALTAVKTGETYTFKMPAGKVTVSATFMEDNTMLNFFVDVKADDYFYDAVLWAAKNGITLGVDETHFAPMAITTRGQMVTFLWRAAGCPEPTVTTCAFTDVKAGEYYYKAVLWAVETGITKGTSDTTFSPDANVSRSQTVTFLARMSGVKDDAAGYSHNFADVKTTDYYSNAVAWAATNKITDGTSATTFSPNDDCLRGQIVTFLYRYMVK